MSGSSISPRAAHASFRGRYQDRHKQGSEGRAAKLTRVFAVATCDADKNLYVLTRTLGGAAQVKAIEMRQRQYWFGIAVLVIDRQQHHRLRVKIRIPDRRLRVMLRVGIAREIASPSDV